VPNLVLEEVKKEIRYRVVEAVARAVCGEKVEN